MHRDYCPKNMKGLHHLEDLRKDEKFLKKQGERVWTGFTRLNGPAKRLPGSKEGNCLKEVCLRSYAVAT
jgi:hypothetical protein